MRKIFVMILVTLLYFSCITMTNTDSTAKASSEENYSLDTQYIFNITKALSDVIFIYNDTEVAKGRSFGSKGEQYAAKEILQDEMIDLGLYNPCSGPEPYLEKIENIGSRFDKIPPNVNLTDHLDTLSLGITINDEVNQTSTTLTEFHIEPMWNWRIILAFAEYISNCSNLDEVLEWIESTFKINTSNYFNYNYILNESWLTKNVTYDHLSLMPRPLNLSWLLNFLEDNIENICNNESIVDYPSFMNYFLPAFQEYYNFTFGELNPGNASIKFYWFNTQWRLQTIGEDENFLYIGEDPAFNPNSTDKYWMDDIIHLLEQFPGSKWLAEIIRMAKLQVEMLLWNITMPNLKGLLLYDFNDNMYNMQNGALRPLPTLYINGSIGKKINASLYNVSFWINQSWTENVESYNVIGQINGTDPSKTVIVDCLYDSWWNQGTGDAAIGMGIVLGTAKYFQDHNITPKYNLKFIGFSGEEQGLRGACHYESKHWNENIITIIDVNQVGFNQDGPPLTLNLIISNESINTTICEIANLTQYEDRLNDGTNLSFINVSEWAVPSDYTPFYDNRSSSCNTICFLKDMSWIHHHRDGEDHEEGDAFKYYYENDVNLTAELILNVTTYFCVDPDCWFTNVNFEPFDSVNDGDALYDSIRANFTLNTILPHDKLKVELLYDIQGGSSDNLYSYQNYSVNSSGLNASVVFSIPDDVDKGNYSIKLVVYNSTGIINKIVYINGDYINDTSDESNVFTLYHPFGYTKIGSSFKCVADNISGSTFMMNENGYADNITAYINQAYTYPGPYQCIIYRANDSKFIANTTENWTPRDDNEPSSMGWAVFNFSEPKPLLTKDTEYVITCWGEDAYSRLYYDNSSYFQGRYDNETYGDPPDPANFTNESRVYSIYCSYTPDYKGPDITSINCNPNPLGYGMNITISADVTDISGVNTVNVSIFKPQNETLPGSSYTMTNTDVDTYEYVFNDTWLNGQYNYSIWAIDNFGNSNISSQYCFNVSAMATVTVCTIQDEYGNNTIVNVTDPLGDPLSIGYELLDDDKVLRIWNKYDSYYFNTSSGIQLTNHFNEYWSHNVLMLGYYNNNQWNLIYQIDELSGFNKNIDTDNETYVNATLWKNLTYQGYDFRLAIRYHLGVDDKELTVIPYIKNLGQAIPYTLGFAWEIKDIQVNMTPSGDYIEINGTTYYLNQSLDETYKNIDQPCFYIREDVSSGRSESLYLCWNNSLDYFVKVKSREGQYNAPITLGIKIGTLAVGQEKYTCLLWYDASEITYFFNSYNTGEAWATNPGYMVDGSTSTYASTTTNGDVELCNGNNCSGSDLGDIVKVELRVYGYYTSTQRDIILTPVFDGTTHGSHYTYITTTTPSWSRWFDITDDPWTPQTWSWTDVDNLDCDVEAKSGLGFFTLYCSKVEMRVTYIPNNNPLISGPVPADGSIGVSIAPVLDITVLDPDGDNMNITWLSNSSGSWQVFGTNNSVGNGTYHQTMLNASVNGQWWYWKVNVTDGAISVESSVYSFYTGYESKIKNTGSTNIGGYLLMQVQFFDGYNNWVVAVNGSDETTLRTILVGEQFGLDTVFNGKIDTAYLIDDFGTGLYRVYVCFRDPDGNVLVCDDDSLMEATYEFNVNI
jgi:hypothetical protein